MRTYITTSLDGGERMEKTDFKNPIDWIIYKVNGKKPKKSLKFYNDTNERCSAWYNKNYICMCNKVDRNTVEAEFNKTYTGNNLEETQKHMKKCFNKSTRNRRRTDISFIKQKTGRMHVRGKDGNKRRNLCSCEESQKEEILARYNQMKKDGLSFDEIRTIFRNEYNLKRIRRKDEHVFKISNNGTVYKDGSFVKIDKKIYELIEKEIMKC